MHEFLDYRTMLFMSGLFAIMLSIFLLAINRRTATLHGLISWACANIFVGIAVFIFILDTISIDMRALVGGICMVFGTSFYFLAIITFEQTILLKKQPIIFFGALTFINICIFLAIKSTYISVLFNTGLCIILSISTALLLLKYSPHRTSLEHRFTGLLFLVFAGLTLYRLTIASTDQDNPIEYLTHWNHNEVTFLACMLSVLAINFGYIEMLYAKITEQLGHAAGHDWLTGAMNRGNLEKTYDIIKAISMRAKQQQAMLLMDLDHFKRINDNHGHLFGDKVICAFVNVAKETMRNSDVIGRYGGEEFCILMPSTNEQEAMLLAERIRYKFENHPLAFYDKAIYSTVSIGVCDSKQVGREFNGMFAAADQSLYAAKKAGRNKVITYSSISVDHSVVI